MSLLKTDSITSRLAGFVTFLQELRGTSVTIDNLYSDVIDTRNATAITASKPIIVPDATNIQHAVNKSQIVGKAVQLWSGTATSGTVTLDLNEASFATFNGILLEGYITATSTSKAHIFYPKIVFETISGSNEIFFGIPDSATTYNISIRWISNTQIEVVSSTGMTLSGIWGL